MSFPKLHHHLPQSYQEGFCLGSSGRLWVFDRVTGKLRSDHPKNVAAITHDYSFDTREGKNTSLELELARIDGAGIGAIWKLRSRQQLSRNDRELMAVYVALFDSRVPRFQRWLRELAATRDKIRVPARFGSAAEVRRLLESQGLVDEDDAAAAADLVAELLTADTDQLTSDQPSRLRFLVKRAKMIAPRFMRGRWLVAHAPERAAFMTCDYPLLSGPEKDLLIFPLASDSALIMMHSQPNGPIVHSYIGDDLIDQNNIEVAKASERIVLASTETQLRKVIAASGIEGTPPAPIFTAPSA